MTEETKAPVKKAAPKTPPEEVKTIEPASIDAAKAAEFLRRDQEQRVAGFQQAIQAAGQQYRCTLTAVIILRGDGKMPEGRIEIQALP